MPTVLTIVAADPLLDLERLAGCERLAPQPLGPLLVVRVNDARPMSVLNVLQLKARVVAPGLVDVFALAVSPEHGDECRNRIIHELQLALGLGQPRLAVPQRILRDLLVVDIDPDRIPPDNVALFVAQ